ncbi:E3 SUMO-protein ligase ZBED1-like [Argopecten irradians]|uniref:E3 SUMO-protein ligase ZBED1-like n=1 Tax=Argopecten irradians TaxID=31199 RepID=UPI00371440C7
MMRLDEALTVLEEDQPNVVRIKTVQENLATRYTDENIRMFLEECTLLDPRFKGCLPKEKLNSIQQRVAVLVSGEKVKIKEEPSETSNDDTEDPPMHELPPVPALPDEASTNDEVLNVTRPLPPKDVSDITAKGKTGLASVFGDVILTGEEPATRTTLEMAQTVLNNYSSQVLPLKADPLKWWKDNGYFFPLLSHLSMRRLCIPATSVPSERVFSTAGDIITAQRGALNSDMVDKLIF